MKQKVPWYVDDLHYAPTLSRAEVDSLLDLLKPFASGLSRADWQAIQRDAFLQGLERRGELVYNVPNLVCKGKIYWGSKVNPYPVLFEDLQRISRGWFEPEDLKFEAHASRERVWEVSFRLANREFREELSLEGGYLDVEFIDVPNKALAEIGVEGRFRHFDYFGESMSYIFLSPKQEEKLKENRLLKILE